MSYYTVIPFCLARIRNSEGAVLIGQSANLPRKPYPGRWDLPGGKIEDGESAEECVRREVQEKLGVSVKSATLVEVFIILWEQF